MSNFKQESISPTSQSCVDDIDRFLNFDQNIYPSPSSSSTSSRSKAIATPEFTLSNPHDNAHFSTQENRQPVYAGPSHQYDNYKQQTGIPSGALASTLAVNQPNTFPFGGYQQDYTITDGYFGMNTTGEMFDFNAMPTHNPSFSTAVDTDMDFDSTEDIFSMNASQPSSGEYVDPNIIGGQEVTSAASTPVQSSAIRVWPGMHQQQAQQAALAKAQAQQKQQQQMAQQPQTITQPYRQPARQNASRPAGSANRPPTDPIVEERISRLLNQMRQNSEASSHENDSTPNGNGGLSHLARQRKDEEDMDEDERLLASEEGKKLSSKERRQLRNKVSARAFRSRRKEYIGQLEGEIATKVKEADELRSENDALKAENTRLTDLTRMLLGSPAFSTFLNELSSNEGNILSKPVIDAAPPSLSVNHQLSLSNPPKDANPNQQNLQMQQSNAHVGMALLPESNMDFSLLNSNVNAWGGNMDFGFNHAQVFSVTEVPQGPAIDTIDIGLLSGKSSNLVGMFSSDESKNEVPVIERMPVSGKQILVEECNQELNEDVDFDESDPAFALFVDSPTPVQTNDDYKLFGGIEVEKALERFELAVDSASEDHVSAATMARFERLCSSMDEIFARISSVTSHL